MNDTMTVHNSAEISAGRGPILFPVLRLRLPIYNLAPADSKCYCFPTVMARL